MGTTDREREHESEADHRDEPAQATASDVKGQAQGKLEAVTAQAQDRLESVKANMQSHSDQLKETVTGKTGQLKETVTGKADQLKETVTGKTDQLLGTVGERGGHVKQAANEKSTQAGEKLTELAGALRDKTGTMGPDHPVATAATKAAGALEQTGSYLQERSPDDWMTDLKSLIARKPLESVLVAAGIGYMAARAFKR